MTTNQTIDQFNVELIKAQNRDENIQLESNLGLSVNYLDVIINNEHGRLRTMIYHKPTSQPHYLPYTSDHPHRYHRNIPYSALLRAARLCSNIEDFNRERLCIDLSLLLSDYPPNIISNQFLRFFQVHRADPLVHLSDAQAYHHLHRLLLHPVMQDSKTTSPSIQTLVEQPPVLQTRPRDRTVMYPQYRFESGPRTEFSRMFFAWWEEHYQYQGSPVKDVRIRLVPETGRRLHNILIHKKPSRAILSRMDPVFH